MQNLLVNLSVIQPKHISSKERCHLVTFVKESIKKVARSLLWLKINRDYVLVYNELMGLAAFDRTEMV